MVVDEKWLFVRMVNRLTEKEGRVFLKGGFTGRKVLFFRLPFPFFKDIQQSVKRRKKESKYHKMLSNISLMWTW